MIAALIITALYAGLSVPEPIGRPILERLQAMEHREPWQTDWRERLTLSARCPLWCESGFLPCRVVCEEAMLINCEQRRWLAARIASEIDRAEFYQAWLRETERLHDWWDSAHDVTGEFWYLPFRRAAIAKCRAMMGREAFYKMEWPPPLVTFSER